MNLNLTELVLLILGFSLVMILLTTFLSRRQHRREERLAKEDITNCRLCGHSYISGHEGNMSHCEICDAMNLRHRNGKLG